MSNALQERQSACLAEIQRLVEYAKSGVYLPLDIRYEHIDLDDDLKLVTASGTDSPPLHTVARVMWRRERELDGDREIGPAYCVVEDFQVWATIDGKGLPMRDITALLGPDALAELRGKCERDIDARLREEYRATLRRYANDYYARTA